MIGELIDGKYKVEKMLGQGGMGSVYEATHSATGRRCAVKVINAEHLTKDPAVLSRFEREARAAGAIETQYITQVLDAGIDRESGLPFLAMEYLKGEDLQQLSKRVGPMSPDLAVRVVAQACLGLKKAHDQDVVHRDIKPHNLFLAERDAGEVIIKLLDFGIAKVKMEQANTTDGADLTRTGSLLGSPLYVSPEQARGMRTIDHRTDLYSLGAVMYQMLAGRTPFHHATALGELILMVCTEAPPPIQDLAPWVPPEVAAIVHKCLEKNPDDRYQSAEELFEATRSLLPTGWGIHTSMLVSLKDSQRSTAAERFSLPPSTGGNPALSAASTTGPLTQTAAPLAQGSSKTALIIAAVAAVGLAGGGVFFAMRSNTKSGTATMAAPVVTATATATAAPSVTATATVAAAPVENPRMRRVQVVILPAHAKVEVEGKPAVVKSGLLEISGLPGTVHRVRAYFGTSETTADVVITEAGALPPKIEVVFGRKTHIPQGAASAKPATAPNTNSNPGSAVPPPKIDTDTGEFGDG